MKNKQKQRQRDMNKEIREKERILIFNTLKDADNDFMLIFMSRQSVTRISILQDNEFITLLSN